MIGIIAILALVGITIGNYASISMFKKECEPYMRRGIKSVMREINSLDEYVNQRLQKEYDSLREQTTQNNLKHLGYSSLETLAIRAETLLEKLEKRAK